MKDFYILAAFFPWLLFGIMSGHSLLSLDLAIMIALASTIIFNYSELKKKYIFTWFTLLFFISAFMFVVIGRDMWVMTHVGIVTKSALALVAWGSILIGKPFTGQYAKARATKAVWEKPAFKRRNMLVTGVWATLFLTNLIITIYHPSKPYGAHLLEMFFTIYAGLIITILAIERRKANE